jgi:hypothetical protein
LRTRMSTFDPKRTLAGSLSGANRRCKKRGAESLAVTRGGPPARRFDLSGSLTATGAQTPIYPTPSLDGRLFQVT